MSGAMAEEDRLRTRLEIRREARDVTPGAERSSDDQAEAIRADNLRHWREGSGAYERVADLEARVKSLLSLVNDLHDSVDCERERGDRRAAEVERLREVVAAFDAARFSFSSHVWTAAWEARDALDG